MKGQDHLCTGQNAELFLLLLSSPQQQFEICVSCLTFADVFGQGQFLLGQSFRIVVSLNWPGGSTTEICCSKLYLDWLEQMRVRDNHCLRTLHIKEAGLKPYKREECHRWMLVFPLVMKLTFTSTIKELLVFTGVKLSSHSRLADTREGSVPHFSYCDSPVNSKSIILWNSGELPGINDVMAWNYAIWNKLSTKRTILFLVLNKPAPGLWTASTVKCSWSHR